MDELQSAEKGSGIGKGEKVCWSKDLIFKRSLLAKYNKQISKDLEF